MIQKIQNMAQELPKSNDCMVDLETLGRRAGCQILSIGACFFTRQGEETVTHRFYQVCRTRGGHQTNLGLDYTDDNTAKWWEKQSAEARQVLTASRKASAPTLPEALREFDAWLSLCTKGDLENLRMWGNGSDFDNAILYAAYAACAIPVPWEFWNSRCFRTLKAEAANVLAPKREGTAHNALNDAVYQAEYAAAIFRTQSGNFTRRGI